MKRIFLVLTTLFVSTWAGQAQSKADVFNASIPVTWLGVDFTQLQFIGNATQYQDAGDINGSQLRDKYFVAWNNLFIDEQKKYDVASAVKRAEVKYALSVTKAANDKANKNNFFSEDPGDYQLLDESKVAHLVSKYNFQGNSGIGMLFFVEGFNKGKEEGSAWVTFVDMGTKKVLLARRVTGKPGGFGFRNYWAKSVYNILKATDKDFKSWKK